MKNIRIAAAIATLFVYGCSEQLSPVEPALSPAVQENATQGKTVKAQAMASSETQTPPASTTISVSKAVTAKDGGTVSLNGSFTNAAGEQVGYNLAIIFRPGDLPSDQTISITIDKTTFGDNADVTFGPAGLVFNNPATLYVFGTNVDVAKKATSVSLMYWNAGTWVPYPDSWGYYTPNFSGIVFASGKIPHFSRYAFGR